MNKWGGLYFLFAVVFVLLFSSFCMALLRVILIEIPQFLLGKKFERDTEETLMMICFILGFMIGTLVGSAIQLELAIWLGFRYGDLPTLPTFN